MTSLTDDAYVGTLHYKVLDPPVLNPPETLQEICDTGNSTNTNINITGGSKLRTDSIDVSSVGGVVEIEAPYRGLKEVNTFTLSSLIHANMCRGDIIVLSPLGPATFTLPEAVAGMNLTLVNTSTQSPRIAVTAGDSIDGIGTFISFPAGSAVGIAKPFVWNVVSPRNNVWNTSKPMI